MALIVASKLKNKVSVSNCYNKIHKIVVTDYKEEDGTKIFDVSILVARYQLKDDGVILEEPVKFKYKTEDSKTVTLENLYLYLKSLPEFLGAVDV